MFGRPGYQRVPGLPMQRPASRLSDALFAYPGFGELLHHPIREGLPTIHSELLRSPGWIGQDIIWRIHGLDLWRARIAIEEAQDLRTSRPGSRTGLGFPSPLQRAPATGNASRS
jgi:hypothetical protein